MRIVVWSVLGLLLAGYLTLAARGMKPGSGEHDFSAISRCEGEVSLGLSSPSTAKFSGWMNSSTKAGANGAVIVKGYVDSQNSFGAMIRTPYTCTINADRSIELSGI